MKLKNLTEQIKPSDKSAFKKCTERFDSVAKPVESLGELETLLAKIAAVYSNEYIDISKKCVLVFCSDNGVVSEGVTLSDFSVTTAIARMMAQKKSCVCVMAKSCGAKVFPIDVGMVDTVDGIIGKKIAKGTNNITKCAAMSREEAISAIELGAEFVRKKKEDGFRIIALGETGIGNTTTASAMASVFLNKPAESVTGRGAGLDDEGLLRKTAAIKQAIEINSPNPDDPIDVLCKLGGFDIAAMTGAFIGGAAYRVPIVMDGVISAVSALTAVRINKCVRDYIIPSHISAEPAGKLLCEELKLNPILNANMRLGEGTGAVALFPLLDMALSVYNNAATFKDIAVDAYTREL